MVLAIEAAVIADRPLRKLPVSGGELSQRRHGIHTAASFPASCWFSTYDSTTRNYPVPALISGAGCPCLDKPHPIFDADLADSTAGLGPEVAADPASPYFT